MISQNVQPFQFSEEHMRLLRRNDPAAENMVLVWVYGFFDSFVRYLSQKFGDGMSLEECEDLVSEFFASRFRPLVQAYSAHSAKAFSGAFVKSLVNFSKDYLRRVTIPVRRKDGTEVRVRKNISIFEPVGGDDEESRTIEETQPELQTDAVVVSKRLCDMDRARFREQIAAYITAFSKGDAVHEWVLQALCLRQMNVQKILEQLPAKFSGKILTANFVYTLWYRFRHDAGLRRICQEYR